MPLGGKLARGSGRRGESVKWDGEGLSTDLNVISHLFVVSVMDANRLC
jgi:hypothetical protein